MQKFTEFDTFDAAMDTILKADPAAVKAAMEADKRDRAQARQTKTSQISSTEKNTGHQSRRTETAE